MANLKRNIWTLYKFLVLTSSLLFAFILYLQFDQVEKNHLEEQYNSVQLFSNGSQTLLDNQEMILDMLAERLVFGNTFESHTATQNWLNSLLSINSNIAAFGLARPDGVMELVSSNLKLDQQPNLLKQAKTRHSFSKALTSYKMVIGRSYYKSDINQLILPIRKAIRDDNGHVLAVMTAGLKLDGTTLFDIELHNGEDHQIGLIRNDFFIQYMIASDTNPVNYDEPLDADGFLSILRGISAANHLTLTQLKGSTKPVSGNIFNQTTPSSYTVKYLPRYDVWAVSTVTLDHIALEYLLSIVIYIVIYLMLLLVFYVFIRSIDQHERERRKELLYQAHHDPLTSLPNQHYLRAHARKWFKHSMKPASLLYLDINQFKRINDSAGHKIGDKILVLIVERLKNLLTDDALLVRESGDEFLIVTSTIDKYELERLSRSILSKLSQPFSVDDYSFILSCSIGISQYPKQGLHLDELQRSADIAMYQAKSQGKNISFFDEEMQACYLQEIQLEQRLRSAINDKKLSMAYQPQIDSNGQIHGVEALVRWSDCEFGFIPPDQFIPIAENFGLMPKLGQLIMEMTLTDMEALQRELGYSFQTAINISVKQITQGDFLDNLLLTIQKSRYNQRYITLEITENLFIEDKEIMRPLFANLKKLGMRISLDDFGTGYSSLSILGELPFDEIKIDKSFVDNIDTDEKSYKMAQNIISIAKNFDREVLAEGVESKEQETILRECGCDLFQGYYYARPMRFKDLKQFLTVKCPKQLATVE